MKILQIAFFSNKNGGIENAVLNWNENIDKKRYKFDFLICSDYTIFEKRLKQYGGKVFYLPSILAHPIRCKNVLKAILNEGMYDVVHIHKNSLCNSLLIYLLKILGVKKLVIHSHNTSATGSFKMVKNLVHYMNFFIVKHFKTEKIACSKLAAEWMFGRKTVRKKEVFYIRNGVDTKRFRYDDSVRNKKRAEMNISQNTYVIGYVARFQKEKNHYFLMDIFAELQKKRNDVFLILAGSGQLEHEMKEKAAALNLQNKVFFAGDTNKVHELYQVMDCFVMPSLHEGFPLVGVEAQTAGLPCVFSGHITKEIAILDAVSFVDLTKSAEQWAEQILSAGSVERKTAYKKIVSFGYDIKQSVQELQRAYERQT